MPTKFNELLNLLGKEDFSTDIKIKVIADAICMLNSNLSAAFPMFLNNYGNVGSMLSDNLNGIKNEQKVKPIDEFSGKGYRASKIREHVTIMNYLDTEQISKSNIKFCEEVINSFDFKPTPETKENRFSTFVEEFRKKTKDKVILLPSIESYSWNDILTWKSGVFRPNYGNTGAWSNLHTVIIVGELPNRCNISLIKELSLNVKIFAEISLSSNTHKLVVYHPYEDEYFDLSSSYFDIPGVREFISQEFDRVTSEAKMKNEEFDFDETLDEVVSLASEVISSTEEIIVPNGKEEENIRYINAKQSYESSGIILSNIRLAEYYSAFDAAISNDGEISRIFISGSPRTTGLLISKIKNNNDLDVRYVSSINLDNLNEYETTDVEIIKKHLDISLFFRSAFNALRTLTNSKQNGG